MGSAHHSLVALVNTRLCSPSASVGSNPPKPAKTKIKDTLLDILYLLVAERGFEPPDLRVMSPTSYLAALLRDIYALSRVLDDYNTIIICCQEFFIHKFKFIFLYCKGIRFVLFGEELQ